MFEKNAVLVISDTFEDADDYEDDSYIEETKQEWNHNIIVIWRNINRFQKILCIIQAKRQFLFPLIVLNIWDYILW